MNAQLLEKPIKIVSIRSLRPSDLADCDDLTIRTFLCPVEAGFPSPTEDYEEPPLNLNRILVRNPDSTFVVRVSGNSMTGKGIYDNDRLIVDKSLTARPGKVVIAAVGGEYTVKTLERKKNRLFLMPHAEGYPMIDITEREDFFVWGVVTYGIHAF